MKISELKIVGFGVWAGLRLDGVSPQLTVIYGPNEAGKTTLMQFLRAMMYGFSPERRARYVPPLVGGPAGGAMSIVDGDQPLEIRRSCVAGSPSEDLEIDDEEGNIVDPAEFLKALGEIDERLFNNVFAFGLDEIQELRTLSEGDAARLLYDLSLGLEHVSLGDVLAQLRLSRERLLASDDRTCLIPQIFAQRERIAAEVAELQRTGLEYLDLTANARQVDREIARRELEQKQAAERLQHIEQAIALSETWRRRGHLDVQLSAIPPKHVLPGDSGERFDYLTRRIQKRHAERIELRREAQKLTAESQAIAVNQALTRLTPRLEALSEQQQWMGALAEETRKLQEEIDTLELQREELRQRWGSVSAKGSTGLLKPQQRAALQAAAKALRESRRELKQLHEKAVSERQSSGTAAGKLQSAMTSKSDEGLNESIEKTGELVAQFRRRVQLDQRLDQMARRETDLGEEARLALEGQVLPGPTLGALGAAFSGGVGLILVSVFLPTSMFGFATWPLALVGLALVGAAAFVKWQLQRSASGRLDRCQRQLAQLQEQRAESLAERDELDKVLPRGGGPLTVRLQKAERELAELEQLLPLAAEHQVAEQSAKSADEAQRQARICWEKAAQRWKSLLAEASLPPSLKPKQLREFLRHSQELQDFDRRLAVKQEEMAEKLGRIGAMQSRIMQLAVEVGLKSTSEEPLAVLREMLLLLQQQESLVERREAIDAQLDELQQRSRLLRRGIHKLKSRRQALLVELGVQNEAQLRRRLTQQVEITKLEQEREELHETIQAAVAGDGGTSIAELLSHSDKLDALREQTRAASEGTRATLSQLFERRGQLAQQLKHLSEDRRLAEKQLELETINQRLREAIDRWRVLAVCGMLLEAVRDYFERERQPEALREASLHLERLTSGKYRRVWTPFGERELRVDDAEGNSLSADVLSRGTREQLFLSLRLALVTLYAHRGVRLPLILDDVLVNFDSPRTKAAASVLKDFARAGHQVLLFTCHEHISKLFKSLRADVRVLPDRANPGTLQPEPIKRKKLELPEVELEQPAEPAAPPPPAPVIEKPEPIVVAEPPPMVEPPRPAPVFVEVTPAPHFQPELAEPPLVQSPAPPLLAPAIDEPAIEPAIEAPTPVLPPPRKVPKRDRERKAVRKVLQRIDRRVEQIPWDAEEFAGELADRVARPRTVEVLVAEPAENGHAHSAGDDDDAAPVRELTRD